MSDSNKTPARPEAVPAVTDRPASKELPTKELPTKERIIDVAGQIFGREGFKAATIRKIAKTADVNIAAVNYHFRDKDGLYRAVLSDIFSKGFERFPSTHPHESQSPPEQRLKTFKHSMFHRCLSQEGWQGISGPGKLIAREFFDPTPALQEMLDTFIKPHKEILVSILSDLTQGKAEQNRLFACAVSIIGQCIYFAFATPIIQQIAESITPNQDNIDFLADHVYRFSLAGIQAACDKSFFEETDS